MRLIEKHNTLIWVGNIKVVGGLHLELVHGGTSLGDVQLVGILAGHNRFLLSCCGALDFCARLGIADIACAARKQICRSAMW